MHVTCDSAETTAVATCCTLPAAFAAMALFSSEAKRLVISDGFAYWTEASSGPGNDAAAWVRRKPLQGGVVETLAHESRPRESNLGNELVYFDIAVGGGRVYFARFDNKAPKVNQIITPVQIRAVPLNGGTAEVVATVGALPNLATDATHLYYTAEGDTPSLPTGSVYRIRHDGGDAFKLARAVRPGNLSLSTTHVYYADQVQSAVTIRRFER